MNTNGPIGPRQTQPQTQPLKPVVPPPPPPPEPKAAEKKPSIKDELTIQPGPVKTLMPAKTLKGCGIDLPVKTIAPVKTLGCGIELPVKTIDVPVKTKLVCGIIPGPIATCKCPIDLPDLPIRTLRGCDIDLPKTMKCQIGPIPKTVLGCHIEPPIKTAKICGVVPPHPPIRTCWCPIDPGPIKTFEPIRTKIGCGIDLPDAPVKTFEPLKTRIGCGVSPDPDPGIVKTILPIPTPKCFIADKDV
jgi:hypothetical protein